MTHTSHLIVFGWFRNNIKCDLYVNDLIHIIERFYRIDDKFKYYQKKHYRTVFNDNKLLRTVQSCSGETNGWIDWTTCYGEREIDSMSSTFHKWVFKVHHVAKKYNSFKIGIDFSTRPCLFQKRSYPAYSVGNQGQIKCCGERPDRIYELKYKSGDIVTMELDLYRTRLLFQVGHNDKQVVTSKIRREHNLKYSLAIFAPWVRSSIELIEYFEY